MKWLIKLIDYIQRETWWRRRYKRITLSEKVSWGGRCLECSAATDELTCNYIKGRSCPCKWKPKFSEKKELKKIVPIFNIGDTIAKKHNSDINKFGQFTITDISGGKYWYDESIICDITEQNDWEIYEPVRQTTVEWSMTL